MKSKLDFQKKRMKLYTLIQSFLKSPLSQSLDFGFIIISLGAVISSSFENLADWGYYLFGTLYLTSLAFLVEYSLRIFSAPAQFDNVGHLKARLRYIFSFYGMVDFVAILPFLLVHKFWGTPHISLMMLPYVFIIFKLIRYSKSFRMIGSVLLKVKDELITAYTACGILVCFSAILMYYIEHNAQPDAFQNIGDGLWWSIVTFTTVGYGDIYPITPLGKILSGIISLIGIAMIAIPTGIISSAFITQVQKKIKD